MNKRILDIIFNDCFDNVCVYLLFRKMHRSQNLNKREADLLELNKLDKTIKLDIRYARSDNFVGRPVYTEARAFLQRPAAEALLKVHKHIEKTRFRFDDF